MKIISLVSAAAVAGGVMNVALADSDFVTLEGVKAVPMAAGELDEVKGLAKFITPGNNTQHVWQGLQYAGDVNTKNNWSSDWSATDEPLAPSYHGLCVATGWSGPGDSVLIVPGGQFQCP